MKTVYFSILFALCISLIRAGGDAYQATWYGGSEDENKNSELNPSCYDHQLKPDTDYYAAISTKYGRKLCDSYAVAMAVDNKDGEYLGKMVKVKIVDSCHECKESHIDLSRKAFKSVRSVGDGVFPVIWVAAYSNGDITREIIYPSYETEKFAQSLGLSKSLFVSMYKTQALKMIKNHETFGKFDWNAIPKTTTTRKTTTTTRRTTTTTRRTTTTTRKTTTTTTVRRTTTSAAVKTIPSNTNPVNTKTVPASNNDVVFNAIAATKTLPAYTVGGSFGNMMTAKTLPTGVDGAFGSPNALPTNNFDGTGTKTLPISQPVISNDPAVPALGDINVVTGETTDKSVPKEAPIVGETTTLDPKKTFYTDDEIKTLESQFPDKENGGSYTVGILSTALTVSGAAGIGILYLKKQSPSKYEEIKQKFPEAFGTIKRGVSRSASGIKRSASGLKRSLSKKNKNDYRAMPNHMFGSEGLPSIVDRDDKYPETKISL